MRPKRFLAVGFVVISSAFAQPVINGIVNAASYAVAPKDAGGASIGNNIIAQGSIFAVFGSGMGPAALTFAAGLPLPTSVPDANGTSIAITGGGKTVNAFVVYTSAGQLAAILPSTAPAGDASVTVTYNGKTSPPATITVVKSQLGIFTANAQGTGPAASQHGTDSSPILLTTAAKPGETIVLYATGLGAIAGADNVPPGAVQVGSNVVVTVAGKVVTPDYAGRSPAFPGLDQINFKIPTDVTTGCYVPAAVTASGQVSQDFVLSIAATGSVCTHPLGLTQSSLATLDSGGTVNVGLFQVLRAFLAIFGGSIEGAGGLFDNVNSNGVFQMYNRIPVAFGTAPYPAPLNGCVAVDQSNTGSGFMAPDFSLIGGKELIADPLAMSVTAPGGNDNILRQDTGGYLSVFTQPHPILGPGALSISGSGGVDVGAFNAKITLPENLDWTNRGNFSTVPQSDLTIVWTGGNLSGSNPVLTVFGNSTVVNAKDPSKSRAKSFYCAAPASAGRAVVPAAIRQQIPSSNASDGETAFASLGITTGGFASFTAPLTKGTLNSGVIAYGEAIVLTVKYQ
ncbi:MAG TPA: hypothetical protein VIX89_12495 [Bryobacteraceae bacterium]